MSENTPTSQGTCQCRCSRNIKGFASTSDVVYRILRTVGPLLLLIFLSANVGVSGSSKAEELPERIVNCTADIQTLDVEYLRRSVTIFGIVFIGFTAFAIIYQLVIIFMKSLGLEFLESHRKLFILLDVLFTHFYTHVMVGGLIGSYLISWLWGIYRGAVDSLEGDAEKAYKAINGFNWTLYALFIVNYFLFFSSSTELARCSSSRYSAEGCKKCGTWKNSEKI